MFLNTVTDHKREDFLGRNTIKPNKNIKQVISSSFNHQENFYIEMHISSKASWKLVVTHLWNARGS